MLQNLMKNYNSCLRIYRFVAASIKFHDINSMTCYDGDIIINCIFVEGLENRNHKHIEMEIKECFLKVKRR